MAHIVYLLVGLSSLASATSVSDRLVSNLSCQNLSVQAIYQSLRPDAFSTAYHMPVQNWSAGVLGECWSLSHTQRLMFYLSRTEATKQSPDQTLVRTVLNQIRGSEPDSFEFAPSPLKQGELEIQEARVRDFTVFEIPDRDFNGDFFYRLNQEFQEPGHSNPVKRGFRPDVETYQSWRFYQAGNLEMGLGSWTRGPDENERTFTQLIKNLDQRRLTLVDLRADQRVQHVVVVKDYRFLPDGTYEFTVYDSNRPQTERTFTYLPKIREFDGQGVMDLFYPGKLPNWVGVFIVDDDDMKTIDKALVAYYQGKCRSTQIHK